MVLVLSETRILVRSRQTRCTDCSERKKFGGEMRSQWGGSVGVLRGRKVESQID